MIGARISKGHPIAPGLPAVCDFFVWECKQLWLVSSSASKEQVPEAIVVVVVVEVSLAFDNI
jgi:hypothetical protein